MLVGDEAGKEGKLAVNATPAIAAVAEAAAADEEEGVREEAECALCPPHFLKRPPIEGEREEMWSRGALGRESEGRALALLKKEEEGAGEGEEGEEAVKGEDWVEEPAVGVRARAEEEEEKEGEGLTSFSFPSSPSPPAGGPGDDKAKDNRGRALLPTSPPAFPPSFPPSFLPSFSPGTSTE